MQFKLSFLWNYNDKCVIRYFRYKKNFHKCDPVYQKILTSRKHKHSNKKTFDIVIYFIIECLPFLSSWMVIYLYMSNLSFPLSFPFWRYSVSCNSFWLWSSYCCPEVLESHWQFYLCDFPMPNPHRKSVPHSSLPLGDSFHILFSWV